MIKRILLATLLLSSLLAGAQVKLEKIFVKFKEDRLDLSQPALLYRPSGYDSTKKYALTIFCHGADEGYASKKGDVEGVNKDGRVLFRIYSNKNSGGPMYFIENTAWPDSFRVGGTGNYEKMFFLAIQAPGWSLNPQQTDVAIKYLLQTYPFLDKDRIYPIGLSAGAETVVNWAGRTIQNSTPYAEWSPRYIKPAAIIPMSQANADAKIKAQRAVDDSIPAWGFGQDPQDVHGAATKAQMQYMEKIKAGFGRYTNYGNGTHCCWDIIYNPSYRETINGRSMNIYEWALQFSRAAKPVITDPKPLPNKDPYVVMFGTTEYGSYPLYYYPALDSFKVLTYWFNNSTNKTEVSPIRIGGKNAKYVAGGFAAHIGSGNFAYIIDQDGYLWRNRRIPTNEADRIDTDTTGAAFSGNEKVWVHLSTFITLKSDGSLWYGGNDDYNLYAGSNAILKPIKFSQNGVVYTDVSVGKSILALTKDGVVHEWNQNGSLTPTVRKFPRPVIGIYSGWFDIKIALVPDATGSQAMGYPYAWGSVYKTPEGKPYTYWGGTEAYSTPTDIRSLWKLSQPIKKIKGIQNATYFIDSTARLFAIGDNVQGELGNGSEWVNHAELNPKPYNWDWGSGRALSGAPPQQILPRSGIKWKDIFTSSNLQFYALAIDSTNQVYFWGRQKSLVSWNGRVTNTESIWPNSQDVLIPEPRNPLTATPAVTIPFNNIYTVSAGNDTNIADPQYTVIAKGTPSAGYKIEGYQWTWNTNPGKAKIVNPASDTTQITNLSPGVYTLTVTMTDNNTATISDDITITVLPKIVNQPPVPNPGGYQIISSSVGKMLLDGSQSSDDTGIKAFHWKRISGPDCTIENESSSKTSVTGLTVGTYVFELSVTDLNDATRSATVAVDVKSEIKTIKILIETVNN